MDVDTDVAVRDVLLRHHHADAGEHNNLGGDGAALVLSQLSTSPLVMHYIMLVGVFARRIIKFHGVTYVVECLGGNKTRCVIRQYGR